MKIAVSEYMSECDYHDECYDTTVKKLVDDYIFSKLRTGGKIEIIEEQTNKLSFLLSGILTTLVEGKIISLSDLAEILGSGQIIQERKEIKDEKAQ